jgi:hypothetical protein
MARQQVTYFPLEGGEDVVSPDLKIKPGRLRSSKNYEARSTGGYRRIDGYERYDGQPKPSLANQAFFNIDAVTNTVAVGDRLTGSISNAVAYVVGETAGVGTAYDFPDPDDVFVDNDVLTNTTDGNTYATVDLSTTALYGPYTTDSDTLNGFIAAAQGVRRDLIAEVPGSGVLRGVFGLSGDRYAFRDNAGGTATDLYKASANERVTYITGSVADLTVGEIVTGGTSSATGIVRELVIDYGTFAGNNAIGILYLTTLTGTFQAETVTGGTSGGTAVIAGAPDAAGWQQETLGYEVAYTTGSTAELQRGEIITCSAGTGNMRGIVTAINIDGGSFGSNNATGTLYFRSLDGTMAAGTITGATSTGTVAIAGAPTAITMNAGGKHETVNHNFFGQSDTLATFGVSGVDEAYMWSGRGMAILAEASGSTGLFPTHIAVHKKHLFLSYLSSMINSETGNPFNWQATGGAGEIAVGDDITGFHNPEGDVLAVFSRNSTNLLFGSSTGATDTFNLKLHSDTTGAKEWTIQRVGIVRYLDDRGLTQLNATDAFGDFKDNAFSKYIDPLVKVKQGTELDSLVVREKDQYRIFFNDKTALFARIPEEGGFPHFTRIEYPLTVNVSTTTETSAGVEELFFGTSTATVDGNSVDGFVFQMDSGNSFDGDTMDYFFRLPFNSIGSPRTIKRFFKVTIEVETETGIDASADVRFAPDFSYGTPEIPKGKQQTFEVSAGGTYYGDGDTWGSFFWGQYPDEAEGYIKGSGRNIGLAIAGSTTLQGAHTITGVTIQYATRGVQR